MPVDPNVSPDLRAATAAYAAGNTRAGDAAFARGWRQHLARVRPAIERQIASHRELWDDVESRASLEAWQLVRDGNPPTEALCVTIGRMRAIDAVRRLRDATSLDEMPVGPPAPEKPSAELEIPADTPDRWRPFLPLLAAGHGDGEIGLKLGLSESAARRECAAIRQHYRARRLAIELLRTVQIHPNHPNRHGAVA